MIRSFFITGFTTYLGAALIYALLQVMRGQGPLLSWSGLSLAAAAPMAFFVWLYLARPARTSRHPLGVSLACGLGMAIAMSANLRYGVASGSAHLWAGLCLAGWFAYIRWYSVFPKRSGTLLIPGSPLPAFNLYSMQGEKISSSSLRGSTYLLLFYRGNWCPLCSAQIAEWAGHYRELHRLGAEIVLISSQPQSHSQRLAKKFEVPMLFFQDRHNDAARSLGIVARFGTPLGLQILGYSNDTAMPTLIISDADGRILHAELTDNYRVRPEPARFLEILRLKFPDR